MNRFTGLTIACAGLLQLLYADSLTAQTKMLQPLPTRTSEIQQTAYHADHGPGTPCEECQQHSSHHHYSSGSAPLYSPQSRELSLKDKIHNHSKRTWNAVGRKFNRWNQFWYAQDQMFRQRNLTQSVALFGEHDLRVGGPPICDQCRHDIPHYLHRHDIPQYPRDAPAIIPSSPQVELSRAEPSRKPDQINHEAHHPQRAEPRPLQPESFYQARGNRSEPKRLVIADAPPIVAQAQPLETRFSESKVVTKQVNMVLTKLNEKTVQSKSQLRRIDVIQNDDFVLPVIRANR
ncbi:hypothetical protein Pla110_28070 [Polystyrenella longa]|uniref:Secreted protein n=1 Tax=Polystyrenella longa TaxID=2528007 RepID=A0A518CPC0_9PLAN|nr:hypothetical protein [Polystyrenella longa]QDU81070.1 hypothetical protein Pla110_28070 [Polystyrenella longa]